MTQASLGHTRLSPGCDISVIICTFNRAEKLPLCLGALLAAKMPPGTSGEIICVDNNSTDRTRQVIDDFSVSAPLPVRYVFEGRQGLGCARNTGLQNAGGQIIAFTDDDCIVEQDWLVAIWNDFQANPHIDVLGGRVELFDKRDLPISIRTMKERRHFSIDLLFNLIPGCNFAFRREILKKIAPFDPLFGAGGPGVGPEDSDFIYRAFEAGLRIVYSPLIVVYHAHGRRTALDRKKLERNYQRWRGGFYAKHIFKKDVVRVGYWEVRNLLRDSLRQCLSRNSPRQQLAAVFNLVGGAASYLRVRASEFHRPLT